MKIISKYKDFYDYLVQDHDSDLIYKRNHDFVSKYYDNLFKKDIYHTPWFSLYYGYKETYINNFHGEIDIDNIIFGVYPYVYSQPIIKIFYKDNSTNKLNYLIVVLNKQIIDGLLSDDIKLNEEAYNNLLNIAQTEIDKLSPDISEHVKVSFSYYLNKNIKNYLQKYIWKTECKNIFLNIKAPVFIKYYSKLFENSVYWNDILSFNNINNPNNFINIKNNKDNKNKANKKFIHYITNISFQKLNYNIIKYWSDELYNLNTYINIENFLWSIKQEPISNPDNKTKILSHGFDLKTSFRKM